MKKNIATISCRACGQAEESILHLLCACPALAPTVYLHRHNLVAQVLHSHLSRFYSLPLSSGSWYSHKPMPVSENSGAKLLWDYGIVTEGHVLSTCPDIVLYDYESSAIQYFEVSCPADLNVVAKETEKGHKYQLLVSELRLLHLGMSVESCDWAHWCGNKQLLNKIPGFSTSLFNHLQKATVIRTIHILTTLHI